MNKQSSLSTNILSIVQQKGTEAPFSSEYDDFAGKGTYLCRQCGLALFRATSKFDSGCGWPSFDAAIEKNVLQQVDPDGIRTEILCKRCNAHLGHVFIGENYTALNTRHCVNSASLDFVEDLTVKDTEEAVLAAGCFWGVEHYFKQLAGVLKVKSGYTGGTMQNPSYQEVCRGGTGHTEAVRVVYDNLKISYENILKYFFEIHDPTQRNRQGPDIGEQYKSAIFYYNDSQKTIAEKLIKQLENKNYKIATQLLAVTTFWQAELYHQDYYQITGKTPYCHKYEKKF